MKHSLIVFALLGLFAFASEAASVSGLARSKFEEFMVKHGKEYTTTEEYEKRLKIFADNLRDVETHNTALNGNKKTWRKAINMFSDLTAEEFRSTYTGGFYNTVKKESRNNARSASKINIADLPKNVDWREKGAITDVKNQGSCGSCWAFATIEQLESYLFLSGNDDDLKELSAQHIVSCASNPNNCGGTGGCQGSVPQMGYVYAQFYGVVTEAEYTYSSGMTGQTGECAFDAESQDSSVYTKGYETLPHNDYEAVMDHIANKGPLAIAVAANQFGSYGGGVFDGCSYDENIEINHAVQLVGYGTDPDEGDYWLVRNSWGTGWGEDGYIRMKREATQTCGTDNTPAMGTACEDDGVHVQKVCGMCGVAFDVNYPIGVDKVSGLEP